VTDQQFNRLMFGQLYSVESARARLDTILEAQIRRFDWQYSLTDAQKSKLLLAGQGDIKRVLDRVDELKRKFETMKYNKEAIQCVREAQQLKIELQGGIFGARSLVQKTIATILKNAQRLQAQARMNDYQSGLRDEALDEVAAKLRRLLNLNLPNYRRLRALLENEIQPPARWGQSRYAYVMYRLAQVPDEKLEPFLGDAKRKFLRELLTSWSDAGKFLENDGFVFDDAPASRWRRVSGPVAERKR
jgi:hypothetical protein